MNSPIRILLCLFAPLLAASTGCEPGSPPNTPWSPALLQREAAWYGSDEAKRIAGNVLQYQATDGGWPKNLNLSTPPKPDERRESTIPTG